MYSLSCSDSPLAQNQNASLCSERPSNWRKLEVGREPEPVCRVQVLFDVPLKQPETKPMGKPGHPALSSKLRKTTLLFAALDLTERFRGPWFLPARDRDQIPKESFGTEGQILLHFSFRPVPQDGTSLHQAYKFYWSALHPAPASGPQGSPRTCLEEATKSPEARQGCHNQQPVIHQARACQEETQTSFPWIVRRTFPRLK